MLPAADNDCFLFVWNPKFYLNPDKITKFAIFPPFECFSKSKNQSMIELQILSQMQIIESLKITLKEKLKYTLQLNVLLKNNMAYKSKLTKFILEIRNIQILKHYFN